MIKFRNGGFRLGLRVRLFLGMLAVTLVVTAGFAMAMYEFVEVLEEELLHRTLERELDGLVIDYKAGAAIAGRRGISDHVFVVEPGESMRGLPAALRLIRPGGKTIIQHNGVEFYTGRRDVKKTHIYLMLSVGTVEALERRLGFIAWLTFAGALLAALIIALLCARWILKPVKTLASSVAELEPGTASDPIATHYGRDPTMRAIAERFDEFVQRFQAFAEREQAFTQDASHELRTPLSVALSTTELLLDDPGISDATRERGERIYSAGLRMQRLVTTLLFLAREAPHNNESCDIVTVIEDILPFYQEQMHDKQIILNTSLEHATIDAPAGMVDCVVHNLVENAVTHTESGHIDVQADTQGLVIRDTGSGIDADTLQHIHERRYYTRHSPGLGIGLYLVQRICTRLGWDITVHSRIGEGTSVEITLPRPPPLDRRNT